MAVRKADAKWQGGLREGSGQVRIGEAGQYQPYSFGSRFEEGVGINPEQLLGAAHAACYSMALSADLERAGFVPEEVQTKAQVFFEKIDPGWTVTRIHLIVAAKVPGIDPEAFDAATSAAKDGCPISRALKAVEVTLEAQLLT
jgi:osmotically inducible protein OsmC